MTDLPRLDRREFLATSAVAAGLSLTGSSNAAENGGAAAPTLQIHPRYHRWHVDAGKEWLETNTGQAHLDWTIPVSQAALVLVDVWSDHYLQDTAARADEIIKERFVPLLAGCRKAGLPIIHAPSPPQAIGHANHAKLAEPGSVPGPRDSWPPAPFRSKAGPYQSYRRPAEPREPEIRQVRDGLTIHPLVEPVGSEPVVATGDELHAVCREKGILFLLYAGFNTNACILVRDYGTLAMSQRGYEVILLRDCTTGMESPDSRPTMAQTNGAILFLEMFGQYSTTSDDVLAGLS
ncbi:Isochorismatase family protein [Caulifigura coniformis]|uniref:Isochorismatase family protein n=1 Tax=Caulifigura coniformis TaxID=2527983 RepID=A0A517S8I5_9PLAN|nr:cysteine hydrolase family protein [Caulifigura coniformis]QDT52423.1 Isochorismatase family protein [Caulifigura coniformis]